MKTEETDNSRLVVDYLGLMAKVALYTGFCGTLPYELRKAYNELLDNFTATLDLEMKIDLEFIENWQQNVVEPCLAIAKEFRREALSELGPGGPDFDIEPEDKTKLN